MAVDIIARGLALGAQDGVEEIKGMIGQPNGIASLNEAGKVPTEQLPSYVDDVVEGYYYNNKFYKDEAHTEEIPSEKGKIYVDLATNISYRWSGTTFIAIASNNYDSLENRPIINQDLSAEGFIPVLGAYYKNTVDGIIYQCTSVDPKEFSEIVNKTAITDKFVTLTGDDIINGHKTFVYRPEVNIADADLPSGYIKCSYIASTAGGWQFIDTGVKVKSGIISIIDWQIDEITPVAAGKDYTSLYGYAKDSDGPPYSLWASKRTTQIEQYKSHSSSKTALPLGSRLQTTFTSDAATEQENIYIFKINGNIRYMDAGIPINQPNPYKVYGLLIYDGSELIRRFIPCLNPNLEPGLYDVINGAFYANNGSGEFEIGELNTSPVALMSDLAAEAAERQTADAALQAAIATKQDKLIASTNIAIAEDGKTISAPKNPYNYINQISDYLFEVQYSTENIDYDYANAYFKNPAAEDITGGSCTGIVKNGRVLRHLDWTYDNDAEFLVRTLAEYDDDNNIVKHASVGMGAAVKDLHKYIVESGNYNRKFKMVPFIMTDGINDAGLYIQSNVVTRIDFDINPGATDECCITMVARYILDHCASFADVENFFNTYHIYNTTALKYTYHFLLAQGDQWEVIEITPTGHITVTPGTGTNQMPNGIMTNFRTTGLQFWNGMVNWNTVENYGIGVERYDIATKAFTENKSLEDLRSQLLYTITYTGYDSSNPWRTEFTDETAGRTVMDAVNDPSKFSQILSDEHTHYLNRNRDEGANSIWQTVHSAIYDLANKSLNVAIQERLNTEYIFSLNDPEPTKQDKLISGQNIKTINEQSLLGSGDIQIKPANPFPSTWPINGTVAQFCQAIQADEKAVFGMNYLGGVAFTDLPSILNNAECYVQVVNSTVSSSKILHLEIYSATTAPYHWEGVYWNSFTGWHGSLLDVTVDGTSVVNNGVAVLTDIGYTVTFDL